MNITRLKINISKIKNLDEKLDTLNDNLYELIYDLDDFYNFVESEFGCTFIEKITEIKISRNEEKVEELLDIIDEYEDYLQELQDIRDEYNSDED